MLAGHLSIISATDSDGAPIPLKDVIRYGWVRNGRPMPTEWAIPGREDEISIGNNLWVDTGRQALAKAFGNSSPIGNYVCKRFGCGTGTTPANVTDVGLVNPLEFSEGVTLKAVLGFNFPAPYIAEALMPLAAGELNGYLITEWGLFTDDGTLMNRKVEAGVNKHQGWSPVLGWKVRF